MSDRANPRPQFRVTFVNGSSETIRQTPAGEVRFERNFGVSLRTLADDEDRSSHEQIYYLAWACGNRATDFETWLDSVDDFEVIAPAGDESKNS